MAACTEISSETVYNDSFKVNNLLVWKHAGAPENLAPSHPVDRTSIQMASTKLLGSKTGDYFVAEEKPVTTVNTSGSINPYAGVQYSVGDIHVQPLAKNDGDEYNIAALGRVTTTGLNIKMGIIRSEILGYDETNKWKFVKGVWNTSGESYSIEVPNNALLTTNVIDRGSASTLGNVYDSGGKLMAAMPKVETDLDSNLVFSNTDIEMRVTRIARYDKLLFVTFFVAPKQSLSANTAGSIDMSRLFSGNVGGILSSSTMIGDLAPLGTLWYDIVLARNSESSWSATIVAIML